MRLICRLLGGHWWSGWHPLVIAGWDMTGEPEIRYCRRCWKFDYNRDGAILTALSGVG